MDHDAVHAARRDLIEKPREGRSVRRRATFAGIVEALLERDPALRETHKIKRLLGRYGNGERLRVGIPDIFRSKDHHPPGKKQRVFAGLHHPGEPVDCRIGIGGAHTLNEG